MRLDRAKLEELRRWGQALGGTGSEESVAAGRAILLLIEELERLRLELWRARDKLERVDPVSKNEVESTLHGRLQRVLGRDSDQSLEAQPALVEEAGPSAESGRETRAVRTWIETLRRQK